MKTREDVLEYGLSFPDTYRDAPFHDENWQLVRYKGNIKAFLWTYDKDGYVNLNVKTDPAKAFFWRDHYRSVLPGYHQNKEHWNTVRPELVSREDLETMIDDSFELTKPRPKRSR